MIRENGTYRLDERFEMRGGSGTVRIEHLFEPDTELNSPARLCAKLTLDAGVSIGFHTHGEEEEIFHIIRGSARVDDNGEVKVLSAGDSILTGNGAGHALANAGNEPLEVLAVIVPFTK